MSFNMENEVAEKAAIAKARSGLYGLLAVLHLKPPSEILFAQGFQQDLEMLHAALSAHFKLPTDMEEGFSLIRSYLAEHRGDAHEALADMRREFTALLRGIKRGYSPPPPYESVYLERDGLVMGESTQRVLACYRKAGLTLPKTQENEPADHIGFELDFLRYLCDGESQEHQKHNHESAAQRRSEEYAFLREHLSLWGPMFCDAALSKAKLDFYKGIAKLTRGFIEFDAAYLADAAK